MSTVSTKCDDRVSSVRLEIQVDESKKQESEEGSGRSTGPSVDLDEEQQRNNGRPRVRDAFRQVAVCATRSYRSRQESICHNVSFRAQHYFHRSRSLLYANQYPAKIVKKVNRRLIFSIIYSVLLQ